MAKNACNLLINQSLNTFGLQKDGEMVDQSEQQINNENINNSQEFIQSIQKGTQKVQAPTSLMISYIFRLLTLFVMEFPNELSSDIETIIQVIKSNWNLFFLDVAPLFEQMFYQYEQFRQQLPSFTTNLVDMLQYPHCIHPALYLIQITAKYIGQNINITLNALLPLLSIQTYQQPLFLNTWEIFKQYTIKIQQQSHLIGQQVNSQQLFTINEMDQQQHQNVIPENQNQRSKQQNDQSKNIQISQIFKYQQQLQEYCLFLQLNNKWALEYFQQNQDFFNSYNKNSQELVQSSSSNTRNNSSNTSISNQNSHSPIVPQQLQQQAIPLFNIFYYPQFEYSLQPNILRFAALYTLSIIANNVDVSSFINPILHSIICMLPHRCILEDQISFQQAAQQQEQNENKEDQRNIIKPDPIIIQQVKLDEQKQKEKDNNTNQSGNPPSKQDFNVYLQERRAKAQQNILRKKSQSPTSISPASKSPDNETTLKDIAKQHFNFITEIANITNAKQQQLTIAQHLDYFSLPLVNPFSFALKCFGLIQKIHFSSVELSSKQSNNESQEGINKPLLLAQAFDLLNIDQFGTNNSEVENETMYLFFDRKQKQKQLQQELRNQVYQVTIIQDQPSLIAEQTEIQQQSSQYTQQLQTQQSQNLNSELNSIISLSNDSYSYADLFIIEHIIQILVALAHQTGNSQKIAQQAIIFDNLQKSIQYQNEQGQNLTKSQNEYKKSEMKSNQLIQLNKLLQSINNLILEEGKQNHSIIKIIINRLQASIFGVEKLPDLQNEGKNLIKYSSLPNIAKEGQDQQTIFNFICQTNQNNLTSKQSFSKINQLNLKQFTLSGSQPSLIGKGLGYSFSQAYSANCQQNKDQSNLNINQSINLSGAMSLPAYIVEQQLEHQRKLVLPEEYSLIVTPSDKSLSQLQKDFIQQILFQNLIVEDIKSIFECKDCQTEGDIVEFQNNFTLKLINSSHHPSIKLSYKSTVNNHPLLHQLLPHVFAAMWDCLFQKNANKELDNITLQLEKLLSKENLPSEVGINILNLDEFMERRETPIPFNLDLLSRIAIKCQMIPAALRYKEMETVSKIRLDINTQFPVWHSLISTRVGDQNCTADQIYFLDDDDDKQQDDEYSVYTSDTSLDEQQITYNIKNVLINDENIKQLLQLNEQLREDDACIGIVQFGEEMFQQQVDAWKHEKMRNWDEAEKLYRQKLDKDTFSQQSFQEQSNLTNFINNNDKQTPTDYQLNQQIGLINPNETASPQWQKNILGLVRCLMQLGEQEEVLRIALIYSNAQTGEAKRKLAVYGAQAALHLHEFDKLKDLIELMDVEQPECGFYQGIIYAHEQQESDMLQQIDQSRECFRSLLGVMDSFHTSSTNIRNSIQYNQPKIDKGEQIKDKQQNQLGGRNSQTGIIQMICAMGSSGYERSYSTLMKAQQLVEVEEVAQYLNRFKDIDLIQILNNDKNTQQIQDLNSQYQQIESSSSTSSSLSSQQNTLSSISNEELQRIERIAQIWQQRMKVSEQDPLISLDINSIHSILFPSEQFLLNQQNTQVNVSSQSLANFIPTQSSLKFQQTNQFDEKTVKFITKSWGKFANTCRNYGQNKLATKMLLRLMNIGGKHCNIPNTSGVNLSQQQILQLNDISQSNPIRTNLLTHNRMFVRELSKDKQIPEGVHVGLQYLYIKDLLANMKVDEAQQRLNLLIKQTNDEKLNLKLLMTNGYIQRYKQQKLHEEIKQKGKLIKKNRNEQNQNDKKSMKEEVRIQLLDDLKKDYDQEMKLQQESIKCFQKVVDMQPQYHKAWHRLAKCQAEQLKQQMRYELTQNITNNLNDKNEQMNPFKQLIKQILQPFKEIDSKYSFDNMIQFEADIDKIIVGLQPQPQKNLKLNQNLMELSKDPSSNQIDTYALIQAGQWIKLLYYTLNSFAKSVILYPKVPLQDLLRLITFIQTNHDIFVIDSLRYSFNEITNKKEGIWLNILPQLIANLDLDIAVRKQLHEILSNISHSYPDAIMFPLIVAQESENENRKKISSDILQDMMNGPSRRALIDARIVSNELIKLSVTSEEYLAWKLNEIHGNYKYIQNLDQTQNDLLQLFENNNQIIKKHIFALQTLQLLKEKDQNRVENILNNYDLLQKLINLQYQYKNLIVKFLKNSNQINQTQYKDQFINSSENKSKIIQLKPEYQEIFPQRMFSDGGSNIDITQLSDIELEDIIIFYGHQLLTLSQYNFFKKYMDQLKGPMEHIKEFNQTKNQDCIEKSWILLDPIHKQLTYDSKFDTIDTKEQSPVLYHKIFYNLAMPGTMFESQLINQQQNNGCQSKEQIQSKSIIEQQSAIQSQHRVTIYSFDKLFHVFPSKQRPRFFQALGNDGLWYYFLLKGKEDLRLDERIMQLFKLINSLFEGNNTMQNLTIRRYPVIPLSPIVGLVGMLNNHETIVKSVREYRQDHHIEINDESNEQRLEMFNDICSQTAARDLYDIIWLNSESTDNWFDSRRNFTRSSAVMSMVGHIIGLGDRHLSNILLERGSSRVVHIDFGDCFEQAMNRVESAEHVPFRLTRMMINAFCDIGGAKGAFEVTCEQTMQLLRNNKDGIMAMLEAFVLDPLAGWFKYENNNNEQNEQNTQQQKQKEIQENIKDNHSPPQKQSSFQNNTQEQKFKSLGNDVGSSFSMSMSQSIRSYGVFRSEANRQLIKSQGEDSISKIERKLKGFEIDGEFFSTKEQVNNLIQKATSCENLSNQYLGWRPFW